MSDWKEQFTSKLPLLGHRNWILDVFAMIDKAASLFKIVVLKTTCTIPYTSLFIALDCCYWDASREHILRDRIK